MAPGGHLLSSSMISSVPSPFYAEVSSVGWTLPNIAILARKLAAEILEKGHFGPSGLCSMKFSWTSSETHVSHCESTLHYAQRPWDTKPQSHPNCHQSKMRLVFQNIPKKTPNNLALGINRLIYYSPAGEVNSHTCHHEGVDKMQYGLRTTFRNLWGQYQLIDNVLHFRYWHWNRCRIT